MFCTSIKGKSGKGNKLRRKLNTKRRSEQWKKSGKQSGKPTSGYRTGCRKTGGSLTPLTCHVSCCPFRRLFFAANEARCDRAHGGCIPYHCPEGIPAQEGKEKPAPEDAAVFRYEGAARPKLKKVIDAGKIRALQKAGWKPKEIAEEMKCSLPTVYRALG